jgi:endo-1,4-beta-xylanase
MKKKLSQVLKPTHLAALTLFVVIQLGCNSLQKREIASQANQKENQTEPTLKNTFEGYFKMGVAVNNRNIKGDDGEHILKHFNSITPENAMKMGPIQPIENHFYWKDSDEIVDFATTNNLKIRGHALCWHEQTPKWIFTDNSGNDVSKEVLLKRLENHITAVVSRYKGKIYAWDVVNEAIDDNPNNLLRNSKWFEICGEDFISKAFEYAHAADPDALLFYNDYNSEVPEKRERIYKLLKKLVDQGVPIHGVGLQAHWSLQEPTEKNLRDAIDRYSSLGLKLEFTELDMSIYPWEKERRELRPNESDSFTADLEKKQAERYAMVFKVFREYKDHITNVTFWNVSDRYSWLDTYPVRGRKNYPLLFDEQLQPKKAFWEVIDF